MQHIPPGMCLSDIFLLKMSLSPFKPTTWFLILGFHVNILVILSSIHVTPKGLPSFVVQHLFNRFTQICCQYFPASFQQIYSNLLSIFSSIFSTDLLKFCIKLSVKVSSIHKFGKWENWIDDSFIQTAHMFLGHLYKFLSLISESF